MYLHGDMRRDICEDFLMGKSIRDTLVSEVCALWLQWWEMIKVWKQKNILF